MKRSKWWWWSEGNKEGARGSVYIGRENMLVFVCSLVRNLPYASLDLPIRRLANSPKSSLKSVQQRYLEEYQRRRERYENSIGANILRGIGRLRLYINSGDYSESRYRVYHWVDETPCAVRFFFYLNRPSLADRRSNWCEKIVFFGNHCSETNIVLHIKSGF